MAKEIEAGRVIVGRNMKCFFLQDEGEDAVDEANMDDEETDKAPEATHWSKLDVKALKVRFLFLLKKLNFR